MSGSTTSELELGDAPAPSEEPGATPQGPLVELFVKTVSGNMRIERAPAPVELSEQCVNAEPEGGLWRHSDFRKLWSAETVSQFGTQFTILALPWPP